MTASKRSLMVLFGLIPILLIILVAIGVRRDNENEKTWNTNRANWESLKNVTLERYSEAQIVLEMGGPPESVVTSPGYDNVTLLGPLASGERDLWWAVSQSSAVGFRIRNGNGSHAIERFAYTVPK